MESSVAGMELVLAAGGIAAAWFSVRGLSARDEVVPLCRSCLLVARPYCTCAQCGAETALRPAREGEPRTRTCRRCHGSLRAVCQYCRKPFAIEGAVAPCRVLAVLRPEDYETLHAAFPSPDDYRRGLPWFFADLPGTSMCVLQLGEEAQPEVFYPQNHALHQLDALWIGRADASPLELARQLDRLALRHQNVFAAGKAEVWAEDAISDPVVGRGLEAWARQRATVLRSGIGTAELLHPGRLPPGKRTIHTYAHPRPE